MIPIFNTKNKFNKKTLKNFKKHIRCFIPLNKRLIQGKINLAILTNKLLSIDFGFKTPIEYFTNELNLRIKSDVSLKVKLNYIRIFSLIEFNIFNLQTFFLNKVIIQKRHKNINFKLFFYLLFLQQNKKRNKHRKYYIKGRILNPTVGGASIGLNGYVCFIPFSHLILRNYGQLYCFYILSIDIEKHILIVSQSKIHRIIKSQLKKLNSRLIN